MTKNKKYTQVKNVTRTHNNQAKTACTRLQIQQGKETQQQHIRINNTTVTTHKQVQQDT